MSDNITKTSPRARNRHQAQDWPSRRERRLQDDVKSAVLRRRLLGLGHSISRIDVKREWEKMTNGR